VCDLPDKFRPAAQAKATLGALGFAGNIYAVWEWAGLGVSS
jgi:hypothetical protein